MRKPAIASDHVEERHGVSRPSGGSRCWICPQAATRAVSSTLAVMAGLHGKRQRRELARALVGVLLLSVRAAVSVRSGAVLVSAVARPLQASIRTPPLGRIRSRAPRRSPDASGVMPAGGEEVTSGRRLCATQMRASGNPPSVITVIAWISMKMSGHIVLGDGKGHRRRRFAHERRPKSCLILRFGPAR